MHTPVPPGPPTPWIVDTGKDFVIVAWKPPLYNGGGDILGYHVEKVKLNIDFTFIGTAILIGIFHAFLNKQKHLYLL